MRRISYLRIFIMFIVFILMSNPLIYSVSQNPSTTLILFSGASIIKVNEKIVLMAQLVQLDGKPLANRQIQISFDGLVGCFLPGVENITTDQNGKAEIIWQSGPYPGEVLLKASVKDLWKGTVQTSIYKVKVEPDNSASEELGRVVIKMSTVCASDARIEVYDKNNALITTLVNSGDGTFDTGCSLICNESYIFKPVKQGCQFTPAMAPLVATCCPEYTPFTFDCSCQAENTGKISVKLPFECITGTIVQIMNSANEVVFVISNPSIEGIFETQCMLLCGESYTVVPIRANCKFTPASQIVIAKCCPDSGQVSFEACLCETPKGKIIVKLPDDCSAYTTLRISKTDNTNPIYLKPDANGVFDSGCVLDCGTTYRIQPFNSTCKFTPEIQYSEAICCSETEITPVTFECTCSGTETKGKIIVKLPSDCLTDTTVRISKSDNTSPIYIKANADGVFDTGCVLVCGTTYRIQPFKTNCKFTPEIQYAKAVCCSETNITPVTFTCSCSNSRGFQIINKVKKPINFNSIFQIRSLWLLKISTQKSMKKYFWLKTLY